MHVLLLCITTLKTSEVFCVGNSKAKNIASNNQKIKTNKQKKKMSYECTFCHEIFSKENDLNRHKCKKTTKPIQKPSFECSVCKTCFYKQSDLTAHELLHTLDTEEKKPFVCKICNTDFTIKNNFKTHMKNVHKEPFTEKDCGEVFKSVEALEQYKNSILYENFFQCKKCTKYFQHEAEFIQHQIQNHQQPPEKVIYTCDHPGCNKTYIKRHNLSRHKHFKHLPCGREMGNYADLKVHQQSCEQCQNVMKPEQLATIKKAKQLPDNKIIKSFKCNKCDKSFQHEAQLIQHQMHEHQQLSSKVIYTCDHPGCNEVYIDRNSLNRHKNLKHLPCGKEFKTYAGIKAHKQNCQQCQDFAESKKLKTIKAKPLTDDQILSAKDKADNTQPEENESTGIAKQLVQNNDLNTPIEIMLSSQNIENNHSPDEPESDNWISWLIVSCPKLISAITDNLSIIKNFIDNANYQDAASTFVIVTTTISDLNKCFSKFKFIDSSCTENRNTAKIDMMCNTLKEIECFIMKDFFDKKYSTTYILQKTEQITKTMNEIFADWRSALQSKNHSATQHENVGLSENENTENYSAIQHENVDLSENENTGNYSAIQHENVDLSENENTENYSATQHENVGLSENEDTENYSATQHENVGLSENEDIDLPIFPLTDEDFFFSEIQDFNSLTSDLNSFLQGDYIETLHDLPLFQQIDRDILLNPK